MATAEALGHKLDELIINRSSIHRIRENLRKYKRAIQLRAGFKISTFEKSVIHWDEKILRSLIGLLVERLPVIISSKGHEQLLGVPKLSAGTGEEQAENVYNLLEEWGLNDLVIAICCDTTASNTGRLKGACVLLEQHLGKDLLYFLCRHHIYELVLRCVFEEKFGSTSGPNIPIFKHFQENWKKINTNNYNPGIEDPYVFTILSNVKTHILKFVLDCSEEKQFREDYRELLELSIIFLGGTPHRGISFRVPGASHHARWMSKAIYCLKIFIFRKQFHMTLSQEKSCRDTCIFIISIYIKRWFRSHIAIEAPYQDLLFIQNLIDYENIDHKIANCCLKKFCGHLWYLNPEIAALAFFDSNVPAEDKIKMVDALKNSDTFNAISVKRHIVPIQNIHSMKNKNIYDFINSSSITLFERFDITTDFLNMEPNEWHKKY